MTACDEAPADKPGGTGQDAGTPRQPDKDPMLRVLIADGNDRSGRERHVAATGRTSAESYAAVVRALAPGTACRLVHPADADGPLPDGTGLSDFDGMIVTGSSLRIGERAPRVSRQLDLMRAAFACGLPAFGSCWGAQIAAVVAGGDVMANPLGPEYGFARRIVPTRDGRDHPLLAGRAAAWDAPAIHLDAVVRPPPGARVLAENGLLPVQAIEIRHEAGLFWGTQYHPELDLDELAAMLRLSGDAIVEAGLAADTHDLGAYASEVAALHGDAGDEARRLAWRHGIGPEVLDAGHRRREIGNFLSQLSAATGAR